MQPLITLLAAAESFDYVIAGGGTCGLVLANCFSQDPATTVAFIDPGPRPSTQASYQRHNYKGRVQTALASHKVILSAGTFRTPLILERSGVGNPRPLKKISIELVVDLPGVGENLVNQSNVPVMFKTRSGFRGGNPYVSFASVVAKSNAGPPNATAIQHDLILNKGVTLAEILTTTFANTVVSTAAQPLPFSRGSINLNDNSTTQENPAIDPKYLSVGFDMVSQIAAGCLTSYLMSTPPLSYLDVGDLLPPDDTDGGLPPPPIDATNREWWKWTADTISSNWHSMWEDLLYIHHLPLFVDKHDSDSLTPYTFDTILEQEGIVSDSVDAFVRLVKLFGSRKEGFNISKTLQSLAFDITGDLSFGETFGALQSEKLHPWIYVSLNAMAQGEIVDVLNRFPVLQKVVPILMGKKMKELTRDTKKNEELSLKAVESRVNRKTERKDFLTRILEDRDPTVVSDSQIAAHASDFVIAGSDTTSTTLSSLLFYLLKNEPIMTRLTNEIRNTFRRYEEITYNSTVSLPYLRAALLEAMRIYPPVPIGLPRIVPEGGDTVDGVFLPGGVSHPSTTSRPEPRVS
ncbi:hypothetical protein GQX73_g10822 [Xylaria multiplex]|uniref:Glucose-methanol-choline oxidoreductase N-terminal domain-containing protein n=1 Tax=Xylaria multiplex TaxID=323545 RepID=A0A7C8MHP3_9PEZI|nr:hypothetical protein GQX73_g10822 [Xylaria multiplex]